jgi:hypothetical protein
VLIICCGKCFTASISSSGHFFVSTIPAFSRHIIIFILIGDSYSSWCLGIYEPWFKPRVTAYEFRSGQISIEHVLLVSPIVRDFLPFFFFFVPTCASRSLWEIPDQAKHFHIHGTSAGCFFSDSDLAGEGKSTSSGSESVEPRAVPWCFSRLN